MGSLTSPIGRLSFPNLFTPRAINQGDEPRYSASFLFDEEAQKTPEYKALKKAALECAREKWGSKADEMIRKEQIKLPFRDAGKKDEYDGYEKGMTYLSPWTKRPPGVIDGRLADVVPSDVFAGCKARFTTKPFAYDVNGNRGVSFSLNNVQITSFNEERLDGAVAANKDFDAMDMGDGAAPGGGNDDDDDLPF